MTAELHPSEIALLEQTLQAREQAVQEQAARLAVALGEVREYGRQLERSEEALRRQTSILQLVLDSIAEGVVVADEDGTLCHLNQAGEEILGVGLMDVPMEHWAEQCGYYLPDTVTVYPAEQLPLARAIRGETVHDVDVFIRNEHRPHGAWVSVSAAPLRDGDGSPRGGVAAFRDVTARKQTEVRLAVQYAVTRVLAESSSVAEAAPRLLEAIGVAKRCAAGALWSVDESAGVLRCLAFWSAPEVAALELELTSRTRELPLGVGLPGRAWATWDIAWVCDLRQDRACACGPEAAAAGLRCAFAFPIAAQGKVLAVLEFFLPTPRKPDPELTTLLTALGSQVGQFVERTRSEEALRHSHALLHAIAEGTTDAVYVKDRRGRYLMINSAGAAFLGRTVAEVLGKDDTELFSPETASAIREGDQRVLAAGHTLTLEDVGAAAGVTRTYLSTKAPYRDASGQIIGLLGISRDISARKQAEEDLQRTATDLARSNEDLQQFAYVVSHDLQEPLRMVSSFCRLLRDRYRGKLDRSADDFIDFAVDGAGRMDKMIQDLLAYSRVGTRGRRFAQVDSGLACDRAVANLAAAVAESGAVVTHGPLPVVLADESQLCQLLQNLLANAIKFRGAEPPRVEVAAVRQGHSWLFSVRDNGIGIDPGDCERIFGVFERLHPTSDYPGTGIGLAICRRIVERHRGRLWAESEPRRGSVFFFTIPGVEEPDEDCEVRGE
jgi:PAS domain S-box-containing protein